MDSLCPIDHFYVFWVKLYSFLYPLSIMTKRGRKCGFFLRFYMLRGEIHAFVRGSCVSSCQGECLPPCYFRSFFWLLVHRSCDYFYIHCVYLWYIYIWWWWWSWCMSSSPIFTCVVSSLSLYTCFFMYAIFISVSHMMLWWVLFKCFKKICCESLSCHELSSCKVFQEFVVGIDLFCNTTSGYEFSDLRLLS